MRALVLLLFLGGPALGDASVKKKGQRGDACKTNADCDQSKEPQVCNNQKKCQANIPPPPT